MSGKISLQYMLTTMLQNIPKSTGKYNRFSLNAPLLFAALFCATQSSVSLAAKQTEDRWFEIEVILLQQLSDDSNYNENFKDLNIKASKSPKNINLIYKHLRNISDYKYLLKSCSEDENTLPISLENPQPWQELILNMPENFGIEQEQEQEQENTLTTTLSTRSSTKLNTLPENDTVNYKYILKDSLALARSQTEEPVTDGENAHLNPISQADLDKIDLNIRFSEVEDDFKPFTFNFYCHYTDSNTLLTPLEDNFYQIPKQISGSEDLYSSQPYLLTKESLELTHIYTALRRSREFRPLAHLAWRQPVFNARKAIPVKLVAGNNLQNIKPSTQQLATEKQTTLLAQTDLQTLETLKMQRESILNEHIQQTVAQLELGDIPSDQLISNIKNNTAAPLKTQEIEKQIERLNTALNNPLTNSVTKPSSSREDNYEQTWLLDGMFKVHLDHYLFINSEFTIPINTNPNDVKRNELLVPFKQNRRVISGEIHYFDHPYMGMIVQIRRHTRPKVTDDNTD